MKRPSRKLIMMLLTALLMDLMLFPSIPAQAEDEYDILRQKAYDMITGGSAYDVTDPDIAAKITAITQTAQGYWDTMLKTDGRTALWSDLASTTNSAHVTGAYDRLQAMTLAYSTRGSELQGNEQMLADIISGLDWMYVNRYNTSVAVRGYDNWWDWQIGCPSAINNICIMIYDKLTPTQITNWQAVITYQALTMGSTTTGANRVWACYILMNSGIILKNSAKLDEGRDQLSSVYQYVTSGDGFYRDGSFIQHGDLAYNGAYGVNLIDSLGQVMYLLVGSSWDITDPSINNIYDVIYTTFKPFIYKGQMMDMVRGRDIARYNSTYIQGATAIGSIVRLSLLAPAEDAANYKSMVKYWIGENSAVNFYEKLPSIFLVDRTKQIMQDSSVIPMSEPLMYGQYANMDRAVLLAKDFGFGLSMTSTRIKNYESINSENLMGWHTGAGMTYLYNDDLLHYEDSYWATVNKYRLPGTTVNKNTSTTKNTRGTDSWVGGTGVSDLYGVSGMGYSQIGYTLSARKSWFMFDDEVVCLGSDISSTDNLQAETIIENRKLNADGNNALLVNGSAKSTSIGWTEAMENVDRIHLSGNVSGADIGYYFPTPATVNGLRESRTGQWSSVDKYYKTPEYFTDFTHNYLNLWFDHGTNPSDASYAYTILPGKTSAELDAYAEAPDITVLENSADAQAVKESKLGIVGVNFWNDTVKTVENITSNKKASVMTRRTPTELEVSFSDPTMLNTGTIELELNYSATGTISIDEGITVEQLYPKIKLTADVDGAKGKSFKVTFALAETTYAEDFSDGLAQDWSSTGGAWAVENNEYSGEGDGIAIYTAADYGDFLYKATSEYVGTNAGDTGIVFRYTDDDNYYQAFVSGTEGNRYLRLYRVADGVAVQLCEPIAFDPQVQTPLEWTVICEGSSISVQLGSYILTATDATFTSGKIGVKVGNAAHLHFDDISVINEPAPVPATDITVNGREEIVIGSKVPYSAAILPEQAKYQSLRWSVVNNTGRAVIDQQGNLVGVRAGNVIVKAATTDGSNLSATKTVKILAEYYEDFSGETPEGWVAVEPAWGIEDGEYSGQTATEAKAYYSLADFGDFTYTLTLEYQDTASTETDILFRYQDANNYYQAYINKYSGYQYLRLYRVVDGTYTQIGSQASYNPPINTKLNVKIECSGSTINFECAGNKITATDGTYSTGKIGLKIGKTTHVHFDDIKVTVPIVPATGISIDGASAAAVGDKVPYTAVLPTKTTGKTVQWSVTNGTDHAVIDQSGILTCLSPGKVTVTATTLDGSNKTINKAVVITKAPVSNILIDPSVAAITVDEQKTLGVSVLPLGAAEQGVVWESDNAAVAAVDQNGRVTGIAPGTATITATTVGTDSDGNTKSATAVITVLAK